MTKKNGRVLLDLTGLVEPIDLVIGDYKCSLTGDMSMSAMARASRAFSRMGEAISGDIAIADLGISEDEMWALADEVLRSATPPATQTARELLTTQAAIKLLSFLASRMTEGLTEPRASNI